MNAKPGQVAVEATKPDYFALKHMPGGLPLDKNGKGIWPADQFTFRLIAEGALRRQPSPDDQGAVTIMKSSETGKSQLGFMSEPIAVASGDDAKSTKSSAKGS